MAGRAPQGARPMTLPQAFQSPNIKWDVRVAGPGESRGDANQSPCG